LQKALSSTKTKKTKRLELSEDARERSGDGKSANGKMKDSTKRISN
jgi:hypothetical protein